MKSVGMAYLEALRRLKSFKKTICVLFTPDEEIGSLNGMRWFLQTHVREDLYGTNLPLLVVKGRKLKIFLGLDEGLPSPTPQIILFPSERQAWWLAFSIEGSAGGHGSGLVAGTAMARFARFAQAVYAFRDTEVAKAGAQGIMLGEVSSVNITSVHVTQI